MCKSNYQKAKLYLKGISIEVKDKFKNDKPAIRSEINVQAHRLAANFNLNEYKTDLLHNYACKLYPKNK